jgi:hypothetical protein
MDIETQIASSPWRGFPPADHECREPLTDAELLAEIEVQAGRLGKLVNTAHERGIHAKVHWIVETEAAPENAAKL